MTDQPEKLELSSMDLTEEKKQELLRLFPEIHTEGEQIDFERLKLVLGEMVDVGKERYGMNWPGKAECFKIIQTPSTGTLLPCPEESINFDTTENLIIEGDNLEVLKLLQKAYLGKVKMIYIDPPYNTGNDFIYPDNYTESLQTYLEYTGQVDNQGKKFGTNSDTDGRFHSRWLNMMYPRLYLGKNLLRDDGIIFISIDDNENANLKILCDDVFGEENYVGTFVWRRRSSSALADKLVSTDHEYVLAYQKQNFVSLGIPKEFSSYSNPDNDPRGEWVAGDLTVGMIKDQRPNQFYPLVDPRSGKVYPANPNRVWGYIKETMSKLIEENRVIFPEDTSKRPMLKRLKSELKSDVNPASTWLDEVGLNSEGTRELQQILGESFVIYPKPISLIKSIINISVTKSDIVVDFFSGSGTTAQAILEINQQDSGNRKFILVQLPEPTGRADYPTIADITKERVRRVIRKLNVADAGQLPLSGPQDRGFRVFKLAESNFKPWNAQLPQDAAALAQQLELHIEHIREGRTSADILFEILLKSGFPLTTPVETLTLAGKQVFSVAGGALLVCLEPELTMEVIRAMAAQKPERVVCLDSGFDGNDQLKTNAVQIFKTQGVPSFKTI
ncbi:MAG: site-specific DNA-methyltransferase [Anaerolineales bacterium]|nr:site-specific DNA-methyltransferase [Anaerolineales bacterium]